MLIEFALLVVLMFLSGFFSSSEIAFLVSNKIKIELRARKNKFTEKNAFYFIKHPEEFFSTILISNNIVNIAYASIITVFLQQIFGFEEFTILIISTLSLLIFGELLPKFFASEFPDRTILFVANPLRLISVILFPLVKFFSSVTNLFSKTSAIEEEKALLFFERTDLNKLVDESYSAGKVDDQESDTVKKVFELGDQKVYEAMTPRTDIVGVEMGASIEQVIDTFINSGYSKLPVFEESLDDIKGIVFVNDIYKSPNSLDDIIHDAYFVPETKRSLDLLNEMLEKRVSIAVVVDEFGGTAGIVTVEDILEEIIGEIRDEYDIENEVFKKIDDTTYVVSAKVEIDRINEEFELEIPEGDYETIGGYITAKLGRIPVVGEKVKIDHFEALILRADNVKLDLIKLYVDENKLKEARLNNGEE